MRILSLIVVCMSCEVNIYTIERERESRDYILVLNVGVVEVVDSRFRIGRRVSGLTKECDFVICVIVSFRVDN